MKLFITSLLPTVQVDLLNLMLTEIFCVWLTFPILNGACELEIIFFAASEQKVYSQMIQAGNRLWPAFLNTILKVIAFSCILANANITSAGPSPTLLM